MIPDLAMWLAILMKSLWLGYRRLASAAGVKEEEESEGETRRRKASAGAYRGNLDVAATADISIL